jgi:hypothetical protein
MAIRDEPESRAGLSCPPEAGGHCVTCSDEALEVQVIQVDVADVLALVSYDGETGEVDISLVENVASGDRLLVYGGVAIAKL